MPREAGLSRREREKSSKNVLTAQFDLFGFPELALRGGDSVKAASFSGAGVRVAFEERFSFESQTRW